MASGFSIFVCSSDIEHSPRADIDEGACPQLYSTTSYSFDPPPTHKIAVKVINHYGDEVLKVHTV